MWVVLRLLTAVIVGLIRFFWRKTDIESYRQTSGIRWALYQLHSKRRVTETSFGIEVPSGIFVTFTREGRVDAFFKTVGLSHEIQTGDKTFDDEVYIASDHPALLPILHDQPSVRRAITGLLARGVCRIYTDGAYVWATRDGDREPTADDVTELNAIAQAVRSIAVGPLHAWRDAFFWRALVVQSIAWSIAFYGLPAIIELIVRPFPLYFDWWPLLWNSVTVTVLILSALFGLVWLFLAGSSRAHRVIVESVFVLSIGVPLSTVAIVSDFNIQLDRAPAILVEPTIVQKYTTVSQSRHGTHTHYHVTLRAPADTPVPLRPHIEVPYDLYWHASPGAKLEITFGRGALRVPWVQSVVLGR